ncbi:MAG: hypothetical protein ACKO96_17410, partial [Flammeovirgaceae bacterium]
MSEFFPEYVKICKRYNAPQGLILGGVIGLLGSIMLIFQGYNIAIILLTCIYPMWMSIKAIEDEGEDRNYWLTFWTVY